MSRGGGGGMMDDKYVSEFSSYSSSVQLTSMWHEVTESGVRNHHGLSILYVIRGGDIGGAGGLRPSHFSDWGGSAPQFFY